VAPRTVNPRAHASRRDEFIDAGQRLIQTRGYEQFSIEDLLAEVGASKGAFYHYFDSKPALLEAIVKRMAEGGMSAVAHVVADPNLSATEKLQRYFSTIAAFKAERQDFLVALMRAWYSDDNAIVREKLRRESVHLVTPHLAAIVRQGVAEGSFTLSQPDQMARVVLSLITDMGDEAGELYLARQSGHVEVADARARLSSYMTAIERVLGVAPGSIRLIDDATLKAWFD
jgi:AcrR family transcriptional regulator